MTTTATKTLEATLAPPTTGKEQRLERTVATYCRALSDAFESGADTQNAVNDVVTPYTLTSYAKDALKNYVPQLRDTYNASELDDDHPVRFTNRGFRIDHSDEREHEFCWRVPQAGRGNAFWIPLRINPEQESLWFDLLDESITVGEFRLQQHRTSWVLHVTVEYEVTEPETPDNPTRIGFDIGESKLLTGCAYQNNTPTQPYIYDGGRARALRKEMHTTLKRLQERNAEQWRVDERFDHYQNALTDIVEKASREAVEYAESFEDPVIVLEDLSYIRENLDYGKYMNRRLHSWAFARLTDRIEDKALEAGIPVEFVNPRYTSQTCHACGHIGSRGSQSEFKCTNVECWVSEYQADINAAANIANRFDPWGESVPWKLERDDSPRDGSTLDSATAHRESSARPAQTTLTEWG
ncbi:RNA-guided endonuclease TnpB family protein [Natrarchaeobaculum sulfurireducens]|uniref:Transposable element, IS605 OrfB family n=1 Tax=Natrarchaeobaculum sulfurireducens TaxID=2044521 RepID=A0A346PQM7_9EURY|nr:RNA-guided endonuclease TnpB family protein [Natrarchaeobaculum sulfurireducens]AXR81822.1 Transposable element, IS605 OrfB family [Natrarchaeobaculum sulfurireducens]